MSTQAESAQGSLNATGEGQANAAGTLGATAQAKKVEKKTPKKLGKKPEPTQQPTPAATPEPDESMPDADETMQGDTEEVNSRAVSRRRQSRGRGRRNIPESDTESIGRSDVSAQPGGGRRNRQRNKQQTAEKQQGGGQLGGIAEGLPGGELVNGATDMVQNTAGNAVNQVGDTVGNALGGLTGGGKEDDGGSKEQLRLRLELNLDIEIQLKAKIHGDLTLGLLN